MRTRFAGKTDVGLQREHNEDNLLAMPKFGVLAVADGMGGHRSGDVASQLAVSTLADFFNVTVRQDATWPFPANPDLTDEENYLLTGLRLANRRIFDRSLKTSADFGMGTTIVAAMFGRRARTIAIAHVGDSRAYRIRNGQIAQLTRDHSLISDAAHMAPWMTEEEVAQLPPNVITRALGIREDVLVDLLSEKTQVGDIYLLCSDGLSGMVTDEQILEGLSDVKNLQETCSDLVDKANFYGGSDNITVMLGRVEEGEPEEGDEDYVEDDDDKPDGADEEPPSRKTEGGTTGRTVVEVRIQDDKRLIRKPATAKSNVETPSEPGKLGRDETTPKPSSARAKADAKAKADDDSTKDAKADDDSTKDAKADDDSTDATKSSDESPDDDDSAPDQQSEEPDSMDGDTDPDASKSRDDQD